ncbi:hypothetical protein [Pseudomonas citri]|uniref:hypothetical protein n=1 Tax=Pseudomonas citri TaxID=2978349 RepID=UPI0021B5CCBF|nr:hypothetical protein [Pseudomonas citri]
MNGFFWPPRPQHVVRTVALSSPMLSLELIEAIREILCRVDALRSVQACSDTDTHVVNELKKSIATHLAEVSAHLQDSDSRTAIGYIAEGLMGSAQFASMSQAVAALDERELVAHVGDLSTWLGKSRKTFSSAFFGTPNARLQHVSDCVDEHFTKALEQLAIDLCAPLQVVPHCSYKIIDLFGIAGEANYFPKHFAYFMPEDQGVKYSPVKRTIVFANTYRNLFEEIAVQQAPLFNWQASDLPAGEELEPYLITWFRGHDLGHSIVLEGTSFAQLSKHDRWGSMVIQEALADVFGFLLSVDEAISNRVGLKPAQMVRVYVLELLRYLLRGPRQFPDAGSAYIQLRLLQDSGVLDCKNSQSWSVDTDLFAQAMRSIAQALIDAALKGDLARFEAFISQYCPHRLAGEESDFMFGLPGCDVTLGYTQEIFEGSVNAIQ